MRKSATREIARVDTAFTVIQIVRAAEVLYRVPRAAILERAGVSADALADPVQPLPLTAAAPLVDAAVALSGEPLLGLAAGVATRLRRTLGIVGVFVTHAPTARAGMERCITLQNRTGNVVSTRLDDVDDATVMRTAPQVAPCSYGTQVLDFHVGVGLTSSRTYSDAEVREVEVPAAWLERVGKDEYERIVRVPVAVGDEHGVRYTTSTILAPLARDRDVFDALAPAFDDAIATLPDLCSLHDVVRAAIERYLVTHASRPTLDEVARTLALSPRTLQARLREEQTSLRALLDEVRERLAREWLGHGLSRDDVSARLGFSEAAAFRRAYRRWQAS
jgi:AraC-like DNA-binding protein